MSSIKKKLACWRQILQQDSRHTIQSDRQSQEATQHAKKENLYSGTQEIHFRKPLHSRNKNNKQKRRLSDSSKSRTHIKPPRAVFKTMTITQRVNLFFKEVWVEMKRVSWLSQKDVLRSTLIVLAFTIVAAAFLGGLDYIFTTAIKMFILK